MSAPDPHGRGAMAAMQAALERARLPPQAIDYVNLHGTATPQNDAMEAAAVHAVLGAGVPVSSTKPLTGHTLAAAGAVEAAICWHTLLDNPRGRLPPHWWDGVRDSALAPMRIAQPGESLGRPVRHVLSNSFAFGGSNACLVFASE
jgi:3-oxoacyl-[acyl-carrier-protein] synthase-1